MKENQTLEISRRHLLKWSAPVVTAVVLPAHAQTSDPDVASLSISKEQTGGPNPAENEGDIIEYTITVENTGNIDLTEVVVTDEMPDGSSEELEPNSESIDEDGVLEVGEVWEFTTTYTVTLDDLRDGGDLVNTVIVETREINGSATDIAETEVAQLCACEGPPVLTVISTPKCSGDPPVGTAVIEITAPGDCPMEVKSLTFNTNDNKSGLSSLPDFPLVLEQGDGETFTWIGPASDAITCLPLAQIDITIEYCCEDQILLSDDYDLTQLLVDSIP